MSAAQQIPQIAGATSVGDLQASVNDRLRRINNALSGAADSPASTSAAAIYGTHAQRVGRKPPADGAFFVETDRSVLYQAQGTQWIYVQGTMAAPFAGIPQDLTKNDAGFIFFDNTNSLHIWRWTGTAWTWGPGNRAAGEMAEFDSDPGVGWALCDGSGSHVRYLANATTIIISVPDRRGFYTEGSGSYLGTGVAAASPPASNTGGGHTALTGAVQSGAGATVVTGLGAFAEPTIGFNSPAVPTFATLYYYRL